DGALARDLADAQEIARRLGFPVVLKAQSTGLAHKSEVGGVIVGIADPDALSAAWQRLHGSIAAARPELVLDGVLVGSMAPAGIGMGVGGRRDAAWGPVTLIGLGGIWIEALDDVRLMPPDLAREEIVLELAQLKGACMLRGARGRPPADIEAVADVAARIGALLRGRPGVGGGDINPLGGYPKGVLALDALVGTAGARVAAP